MVTTARIQVPDFDAQALGEWMGRAEKAIQAARRRDFGVTRFAIGSLLAAALGLAIERASQSVDLVNHDDVNLAPLHGVMLPGGWLFPGQNPLPCAFKVSLSQLWLLFRACGFHCHDGLLGSGVCCLQMLPPP